MSEISISVDVEDMRLDQWLATKLPDYSRSQIVKLMADQQIWVKDQTIKASSKLKIGTIVHILPEDSWEGSPEAEEIPLEVVYEDQYLLVINKVQGMVVHPAPGHHSGTLVNALMAHCQNQLSDIGGIDRPGIVHRIDKDTSGLILAVKDNRCHRLLAEQIKGHEVQRVYHALAWGHPASPNGTIDAPIGRDPKNRKRMAVVATGKEARTHFTLVESFPKHSHLRLELETGRTHQIRVHLSYIGLPLIADPLYTGKRECFGLKGQALHASELHFVHPITGEKVDLSVPLPQWFTGLLDDLSGRPSMV